MSPLDSFLHKKKWRGLSPRAIRALVAHGYDTKQKIRAGIKRGDLSPTAKINNYGTKTHAQVCVWLKG